MARRNRRFRLGEPLQQRPLHPHYLEPAQRAPSITFADIVDRFAETSTQEVKRAMAQLTLGDRIGERIWSRLQEMCVTVEMKGEDFRQKVRWSSFA